MGDVFSPSPLLVAFKYTLEIDQELKRVGLFEDFRISIVNKEYVATSSFSCEEPITLVLAVCHYYF